MEESEPGVRSAAGDGLTAAAVAVVVERVAVTAPGPALATTLGTLDHSLLDDDPALTVTAAWTRLQAWTEAGQARALATFADRRGRLDPDAVVRPGTERLGLVGGDGTPLVEEFAATEVGAVLGVSSGAARARLADALDLRHRLPATLAALRLGVVDGSKARTMARLTRRLDRRRAAVVDAELADRMERWSWRRCDREVTAAVDAADPAEAQRRREQARDLRSVDVGPSVDGVRDVFARLDAAGATRLDARVDQVADWLGEVGDTDPKAVRRASALGVLADPDEVTRLWAMVQQHRRRVRPMRGQQPDGPVTTAPVPATTVYLHLRRDDAGAPRWEQAARDGRCPLTAAEAHGLLRTSRVTLRPVLDLARVPRSSGYRPSRALAEAVRLACPHDVFPFSDTPAERCELDHDVPWPLGFTELANLSPKTTGHHRAKTHGRWRVHCTGPGSREWTSPTGRRFLVDVDGTWRHHAHAGRNPPRRT